MTDEQIIQLYNCRNEQAIAETLARYGTYCSSIAAGILDNPLDVEEVLADTWKSAWDSIPPQKPKYLRLYLGRITRNLALSRWRTSRTYSRGGGQTELALDELGDVAGGSSPEEELDARELSNAVTAFLKTQPPKQSSVFLHRYYYMEDLPTIAFKHGISETNTRMILCRTRQKLKKYLQKEGLL